MEISKGLLNAIKGDWRIGKNCAIEPVSGWKDFDFYYIVLDKNGEVIDYHLSDYCRDDEWRKILKEKKVADEVIEEIIRLRHS